MSHAGCWNFAPIPSRRITTRISTKTKPLSSIALPAGDLRLRARCSRIWVTRRSIMSAGSRTGPAQSKRLETDFKTRNTPDTDSHTQRMGCPVQRANGTPEPLADGFVSHSLAGAANGIGQAHPCDQPAGFKQRLWQPSGVTP